MALYGAKADGRGTYRFFEPEMDARMQARRELEIDLRNALANDEFELYYQPLVNLQASKISAVRSSLALAPSEARHDLARGVRSARGRDRPHHPAR